MPNGARPRTDGPYLSAAFLCEKVLIEQDGIKSAIRIIDRVTRTAAGPNPPTEMGAFDYGLTLLIKFKSGWARGAFELRIVLVKPSGDSPPAFQSTIHFEGEEDRGADIVSTVTITLDQTGIYWFEVYLSETFITRIPLRVIYVRQITQTGG